VKGDVPAMMILQSVSNCLAWICAFPDTAKCANSCGIAIEPKGVIAKKAVIETLTHL